MCHGRPRSSSATSPDSTEDTTPRPSISSLRSRFEGLAAGTSEPKAGGGDARRTSSAGGRKPNGNVDAVRGAPVSQTPPVVVTSPRFAVPVTKLNQQMSQVSRISKSRQPNSPPSPPSDPSAIASDPLPVPHPPGSRPGEARRPVIVSTPASPARMSESSSLPNPMIIPASLRDSSSSSAAPSNSPVLGASPVLLSPKPARRTAPAVPPKMRSPFSTPNGSDDGADTSYRDQVASVTALRKRFSASPSPEAESSTAHRSSITLSQGPSVVDSVDRLAPTAMARQLSVPSFERKSFRGAAPPADDSSLLPSSDAKSPGIIGERTTARNPPPPPPPLSRSASPGPSQTKSDRNKSSTGGSPTAGSFPSNAKFPAELAPQDETNPGPPSLPVRKSASSTPDPGFSTSLPTLPGPRPKVSPSTPILRGPSAESAIRAPPLPDRARAHSIGKIGDPRSPHIPPKLPSRTATVAIPASDPAHAPASSMPSSIPISPDRTRDLENGYQPLRPPVRSTTIGVVASPPRRADTRNTGMSSDDEDEEDTLAAGHTTAAKRLHEDYPDSTHANRRHPRFIPDVRISSMHHVNSFAVFGRYVCTGAHHVRVYDTQMSDRPLFTVDLKDVGLEFRIKEPRVTAMCFRPVSLPADEGRYLWCGTKDGHLWELDIRTGTVTDRRSFVHGATVVSILRHQKWLITVDENGKVHIFEMPPTAKGGIAEDASSVPQTYRTIRITEKFTFVKMIRGKLWTSSAPASRSTTNTSSRGATIRVYDLFTQEPVPPSQSMFTSEWTGAVTSGTILPLKPDVVYIGHEGGFVSVWSADYINCLQVLKTSTTDILSLEGVGERLWVGNRKGQIHVYDVNEKPWRTTNIWTAHP